MKLKITTLVIVEEGQVQNIYHSLEDNQDKAYQEIINQVNDEYRRRSITILFSTGYQGILRNRTYPNPRTNINRIQNRNIRPMKKKSKNQVYIPHQDKWNEHFPTPGKPNPNYYTDSGAIFNKHLRTQNKLKQKRK